MSQSLVQSIVGASSAAATTVTATFAAGATRNNLIVCVVGMDKSSGVITPPTGFATLVQQDSASVSTWVGVKTADGGETAISFTRATASTAGDTMWIEEWSDPGIGQWRIFGLAKNLTDETTRTVTPSGTTNPTLAMGRACAYFTIDSGQSNTGTLSYTNGYTNIRTYAASGRGDVAAANLADVAAGTSATTSQTHTPTADQTSGVIVVFGRAIDPPPPPQFPRIYRGPQWLNHMRQTIPAVPSATGSSTPITLGDDPLAGTEGFTVAAAVPLADTAAGTDSLAVNAAVPLSDTGAGTDALSVAAAVPLADTLSGTDALSITVSIPLAETGTLTDALTVVGPVLLKNSTEQVTPSGTTVTTGNSGGGGDAAWDATSIGTGATDASDSAQAAHGSLSNKLATGGTAGTAYNKWTTSAGSITQHWFRIYLYFTANPTTSHRVYSCFSGATLVSAVRLSNTGVFALLDAAQATIIATTTPIPLNQWFRIEGFVIGSATVGQVELKVFTNADDVTPVETVTSAATQNLFGVPNDYRFGMGSSLANVGPYWQDDVALSSTGYVGPAATPVTLTDTGTGTDALTIAATDTLAEAVSGTDSLAVTASVPLADTGSGADTLAVSAAVPLTETGHGTDALTANAAAPQADTATGTEGLSITVQVILSDTGTLTDALIVGAGNTPSLPDTATGTEGFTVQAAVPLTDTGHGTDGFTVTVAAPLADTGTLSEGFSIVKVGAGFTAIGIAKAVTLWDDGAPAITLWADGPAVESIDDAIAVSLWQEGPAITAWDAGEAIEAI